MTLIRQGAVNSDDICRDMPSLYQSGSKCLVTLSHDSVHNGMTATMEPMFCALMKFTYSGCLTVAADLEEVDSAK